MDPNTEKRIAEMRAKAKTPVDKEFVDCIERICIEFEKPREYNSQIFIHDPGGDFDIAWTESIRKLIAQQNGK